MNELTDVNGMDIFESLGLRTPKNGVAACPGCHIVIQYPNITEDELEVFCNRCHDDVDMDERAGLY